MTYIGVGILSKLLEVGSFHLFFFIQPMMGLIWPSEQPHVDMQRLDNFEEAFFAHSYAHAYAHAHANLYAHA